MADDDTLPAEVVAGSSDAPPASWEHYELGERLGEGGMGVVYKARDRRLDRTVAIKLIRGGNPTLTMRLLREARAQARIDHPGVCRVYEVGEVAGRAYIALQFVAGEPLGTAAAQMTLDEKIAVLRDVAIAIHEAHRLGIVHRDLKPGNVLVERGEDGRPQPIVMDFGLARETTLEVGLTESGTLLGTPAYMSPEQARGDVRAIDRRSDVYSLGATLYELLTGQPPFPADSLATALDLVLNHDPVAPRRIVPTLPIDPETIALKCMAKDPAQRYASARALADDLTRYLDGEPILGRRATPWQRLRASMRKHRAIYSLGTASAAALMLVGALGIRSYLGERAERARAGERTQLAEKLGRDAKEIELAMQAAYQLPLHDVRRERERVKARMKQIADTPHDLGELGYAVIHDALGRGYLALHEWTAALVELERAEHYGLDTPELHAARARALGELYHRSLEEARRSGDKAWLAAREKELEDKYLTPALAELGRAGGAADSSALLDVLVALYRRDYASAKTSALAIAEATPWVVEARKLGADAAYAAAVVDVDRGNYDAARTQLDEASALYAEATEVARSDASLYEAAAQARLTRAEIDLRQSKNEKEVHDSALALIDRAIVSDPDGATAYTTKAYVLLLRSRSKVDGTGDRRPILEQAAAAAERATTLDPRDAGAWDALGNAHVSRGTYEQYHGGKGEPWWRQSLDEFMHALGIRPNDPWPTNDLGTAHRWLGTAIAATGGDPMPELKVALGWYQHATVIDPGYVYAWSNQSDVLQSIASYQLDHGADPLAAIDDAIRAGEKGLAIDPSLDMLLKMMAAAEIVRASYLVETEADPVVAIAAARGYLDRADKLRPDNMTTWFLRARAARIEARSLLARAADARPAIATAKAAIAEAYRLNPTASSVLVERAEIELVAADLDAARADSDMALAADAEDSEAHTVAAAVQLAIAERTKDRAAIDSGLAHIDRVLAIDKTSARATKLRAALGALR